MPYEPITKNTDLEIGKGSRLKDRGEGTWTVSSSFSGSTPVKITLILLDPAKGNFFYNKHVQRRGESAKFVMDLRNPKKSGGDYGFAMDQVGTSVISKNTNKSTTIRLDRIDQSHMIFKIAEALYKVHSTIALDTYTEHMTDVDFVSGDAVISLDGAKQVFHSDVAIGGEKTADSDTAMTFNISHCVQA